MIPRSIEKEKPEITIGVLGQDGHGKTTLTTAIAQTLSRQNGIVVEGDEIVINPGDCREADRNPFVYETSSRRYKHVDCFRHMDVMRNLIMGWFPLHGAILVVSATEGVIVQAQEQVRLARSVGLKALVVFLNKCDLAHDLELLDVVELEVRYLLSEHGYSADTPIIRGSATAALQNLDTTTSDLWSSKIGDLLDALDATIPVPTRSDDKPFLMNIEEVYTIETKGTIVSGLVERGICRMNTHIEIVGFVPTRTTICLDVEQFHKKCDTIRAGGVAGMMLRGVTPTDVKQGKVQQGQVLAAPGTIQSASWFRAELYLLTRQENGSDRPVLSGKVLSFFIRTVEISGTLKFDEKTGPLHGGDIIRVAAVLETYIALEPGLRFILRENGRSLGIGVVTEILF